MADHSSVAQSHPQTAEDQTGPMATLRIVTANRLIDGAVVYMTQLTQSAPGAIWSEKITEAAASACEDHQATMLAQAEVAAGKRAVVSPYLIAVEGEGASRRPVALRERIRAGGPTIRLEDNRKPRPNPSAATKRPHNNPVS